MGLIKFCYSITAIFSPAIGHRPSVNGDPFSGHRPSTIGHPFSGHRPSFSCHR
jgi:hypothetical protein